MLCLLLWELLWQWCLDLSDIKPEKGNWGSDPEVSFTIDVKTENKAAVIVSGIKVADKIYNKEASEYTGTAKAILESDQQEIDISKFKYTWLDKDGKELSENEPPVNTGKYKLLVEVPVHRTEAPAQAAPAVRSQVLQNWNLPWQTSGKLFTISWQK